MSNGRGALAKAEEGGELDEDEDRYASLALDADESLALAELDLIAKVKEAPAGKWTAFMTLMERRWPDRWSLSQRLTIEQEQAEPDPASVFPDASPAELVKLAQGL
jgi:hypothetical protein